LAPKAVTAFGVRVTIKKTISKQPPLFAVHCELALELPLFAPTLWTGALPPCVTEYAGGAFTINCPRAETNSPRSDDAQNLKSSLAVS
jgi:hypothetical protein